MDFLKGYIANAAALSVCAPFDTIKTHYQTNNLTLAKTINHIKNINGAPRYGNFYAGLGSSLLTYPIFWGTYFQANKTIKENIECPEFVSSYTSACIGSTLSNPLFVTKVKSQKNKIPIFQATKLIVEESGFRGFSKGLPLTCLANTRIAAVMHLNEQLNEHFSVPISALISKSGFSLAMYPLDTIRTIQRNQPGKSSALDIGRIMYNSGIRTIYRGGLVYTLATTPQFVIMMIIMEL